MRIPHLLLFWLFVMVAVVTAYGCGTYAPVKIGTEAKVITLTRAEDAAAQCRLITASPHSLACARWTAADCVIVLAPWHDNEVWGHELRHCFDGAWH